MNDVQCWRLRLCVFFYNDTATTEIYTLSLHDALPISRARVATARRGGAGPPGGSARRRSPPSLRGMSPRRARRGPPAGRRDRKSTRLNSSHANISYAVFCLKKKKHYPHHATAVTPSSF